MSTERDRGIKALDTTFDGHRFRSRTEARWAVFFKACEMAYEYEPQGVSLPSGPYLPDFYLPAFGWWFEVKGSWSQISSLEKYHQLAQASGKGVIVAADAPRSGAAQLLVLHPEINGLTFGRDPDFPDGAFVAPSLCTLAAGTLQSGVLLVRPMASDLPIGRFGGAFMMGGSPNVAAGYRAAMSARFEHGARP